jgi:hypothetical protein
MISSNDPATNSATNSATNPATTQTRKPVPLEIQNTSLPHRLMVCLSKAGEKVWASAFPNSKGNIAVIGR